MRSKLVHIQRAYIHFCSHAVAELGVYFLKNLSKTLENGDIAWSWSNKVQIFILNHYDYAFFSEEQCFVSAVFHLAFWRFLQRRGACFQSLSVGFCWKEPGCHGCSRDCILHSESPYAAPFVLHKMVCLKACINVPLLIWWVSFVTLYVPLFFSFSPNFSAFFSV